MLLIEEPEVFRPTQIFIPTSSSRLLHSSQAPMYQWCYQAIGHPQYGNVVIAGYQDGREERTGMCLPFAQQHQLSLLSNGHDLQVPVFNSQWCYQRPHSYVAVAPSPYWQVTPSVSSVQDSHPGAQHQGSFGHNSPRIHHPIRHSPLSDPTPQAQSSAIMGPPRKPRQSGYALWVGNLPQNTQLEEMKDFFASEGIESIFFIRRSHCAFVNYSTQKACEEAMAAFHLKGNCLHRQKLIQSSKTSL
jgi:hypothetical protein